MMLVPDLKTCCRQTIIHHIIGDGYGNVTYYQQQEFLLQHLDNGAWGTECLHILDRLVTHNKYFLLPRVILALLPNTTKQLCLKECPALTEECLNTVLDRCRQLQTFDITENPLLRVSNITLFSTGGYLHAALKCVILEDCSQVKDCHVQALLCNAPNLQHLNIAQCDITDQVFLLDEERQLAKEANIEETPLTYNFQLQTVDVSRCSDFTSTGVRHLCTLCGPNLRSVNLAYTKVDCTAFLYLSGLGLPSAVEFFMSTGEVSSELMEPMVYNLHQFDTICADVECRRGRGKGQDGEHLTSILNQSKETNDNQCNLNGHDSCEELNSNLCLLASKPAVYCDDEDDSCLHLHNNTSDRESNNNEAGTIIQTCKNKTFFNSNITSISFTAAVFSEQMLSLWCFQKFLTTNKNIVSLVIYSGIRCNFLSDNVLDLVGSYTHCLESLCVEGSDKLTDIAMKDMASHCQSTTALDLTGVSFVGDDGIIPLVKSLPLTHLKLAETRITEVCLNHMSKLPIAEKLQEIDFSWCEEIDNDEAMNNFIASCPLLEKLMLRECCKSSSTLTHIAKHSHRLTELSLASNMSVVCDEFFIPVTENLPLLTFIDLGWNSYLTNPSIHALLSNCSLLTKANLEGLKLITASPFEDLISVPEELCDYLENRMENSNSTGKIELSDLPCLPHRSSSYCTSLKYINLTYSDYVEDTRLQQIVTILHGGIEVLDYYGNKVEPSKLSLETYLMDYTDSRGLRD